MCCSTGRSFPLRLISLKLDPQPGQRFSSRFSSFTAGSSPESSPDSRPPKPFHSESRWP